jgi:predicted tellurium resistance membrane protein TerC
MTQTILVVLLVILWLTGVLMINHAVALGSPHFPRNYRWGFMVVIVLILPLAAIAQAMR